MVFLNPKKRRIAAMIAVPALAVSLASCAGGGSDSADEPAEGGGNPEITLRVATSQADSEPNYYCGVELLKERLEAADVGLSVDLFPSSQLGPDTERFVGVQNGDIDIDLQGGSGMSTSYGPIAVPDAAYIFDDVDAAFDWIDSADEFFEKFREATGVTIADAWYYGSRTFSTVDVPIKSPDDLSDIQIRMPDSPQFLANAEAMGVNAVSVAYEEVYVALQQGIAAGQENPITGTHTASYDEILNTFSLNNHQISLHYITVSDVTLDKMSDEQKELLFQTIHEIRPENRKCVEEDTEEILDEYRDDPDMTVIETEDIDLQAFRDKAEAYFLDYFEGEDLELYKSIRAAQDSSNS